jgi:IS5 family transposase
VPWAELEAVIEPAYPTGMCGRPPIGLSRMLQVYFIQQWHSLSDEAVEDAIYDSQSVRAFVGVDLGCSGQRSLQSTKRYAHLATNTLAAAIALIGRKSRTGQK